MDRVRIALIGCGGIARGHIDAYTRMRDLCELAYCVDIDEQKARAFAERGSCRWATGSGEGSLDSGLRALLGQDALQTIGPV